MKIVATIAKSAGNETVGEMWHETRVFDSSESIDAIYTWWCSKCRLEYPVRNDIVLTIDQGSVEETK